MGWEGGVNKGFAAAPHFNWIYTGLIVIGAAAVLVPNAPLIGILLASQTLNGLLLPVTIIFAVLLINKKDLMGEHVNGRIQNVIAWGTAGAVILLSLTLAAVTFIPGIAG
jgi:Mn2+/Fe2+ NRAMP family transporter